MQNYKSFDTKKSYKLNLNPLYGEKFLYKPRNEDHDESLNYLKEISKKNKLNPKDELIYQYENKSTIPIKPIGLNIQNPEGIIQKNYNRISYNDKDYLNDQELKFSKIIFKI
jgi:hypothetical protein